MIGIIIGVTAVVALIGLGEGLKTAIASQFGITSTEVLTVQAGGLNSYGPPGSGAVNPLTKKDSDALERISYVQSSVGRIIAILPVDFNEKEELVYFVSIPDGEKRKLIEETSDLKIGNGRLLKDGDKNKIILGYNFASDKNQFNKKIIVGSRVIVKGQIFEVTGILKKRGSFIVDNAAFMNEDPLREITGNKERVDVIGVKVKSKEVMEQAKNEVEKVLRKRRDVKEGEEDFTVQTPQAALANLNQVLTGVQIFIVIVASISIFVGALGIINTMLTAVLERRSQIGIMKAIGARNQDIFMLFLIESGILGLIGGLIGIILGTAASYFGTLGINSFVGSSASPQINIWLIASALIGCFIIGAVSGIVPAMRAARQKPVDALRG